MNPTANQLGAILIALLQFAAKPEHGMGILLDSDWRVDGIQYLLEQAGRLDPSMEPSPADPLAWLPVINHVQMHAAGIMAGPSKKFSKMAREARYGDW